MKFGKKPVVVEATQWFKDGDHSDVFMFTDVEHPLGERGRFYIRTLESEYFRVMPGDWIITGVKGEFHSCKDEIFRMTYEPVKTA